MEARSFDPGRQFVGEWKSPNLLGKSNEERDAALLDSMAQLHRCVETGHRKSTQARRLHGGRLTRMERDVRTMMVAMGLKEPNPGEKRPVAIVHAQHPPGVLTWSPKKLAGWLAASIGGTMVAVQGGLMAIQATDWKTVGDVLEKLAHLVGR